MIIKDITRIAALIVILFVQEQVLLSLPNIQLTVLLILIYSRLLGFKKTSIIIFIHVILDSLAFGGITFYYTPFMFLGWLVIPIGINTIFKKVNNIYKLSLLSVLFSFLYSWVLMLPSVLVLNVPFLTYFIADIPFEILLAMSSFVSTLYLLEPLEKVLNFYLKK